MTETEREHVLTWCGQPRHGEVGHGWARCGWVGHGMVWHGRAGVGTRPPLLNRQKSAVSVLSPFAGVIRLAPFVGILCRDCRHAEK